MRRRPSGTGSIFEKKDGKRQRRFVAAISLGLDPVTGKRKRKILGTFAKSKEAQKALDQYNCHGAGRKAAFTDITFGAVWQAVLAERIRRGVKTQQYCHVYYGKHLKPLHNARLADIKTMHLQHCLDAANLSPGALRSLTTIYHWVYAYALANDLIDKDYSRFVVLPPMKKSELHQPFTTSELRTLWKHSDDPKAKLVLIMAYTGMRQVEIAQMKMENVHLKERYMIGGSKTDAGRNRCIPIAQCILPLVEFFYTISRFDHSETLLSPNIKGFLSLHGTVNIRRMFKRIMAQFNLQEHRSHDARHTFVTLATNWGIPDTIIKKIVGHVVEKDVTKSVYTHSTVDQYIQAVDTLPWGESMFLSPAEKEKENGSQMVATQ